MKDPLKQLGIRQKDILWLMINKNCFIMQTDDHRFASTSFTLQDEDNNDYETLSYGEFYSLQKRGLFNSSDVTQCLEVSHTKHTLKPEKQEQL